MNSANKVNVMVDIETLDVEETAVILSIGACTIEPITSIHSTITFYEELDPVSQPNRTQSQSTIDWWKTQVNYPGNGTTSLKQGLVNFSRYLSSLRATPIIWCKGTDFDTKILAHAFKQEGLELPWKYNAVRDFRTVKKLFPVPFPGNAGLHHALNDAIHQTEELKKMMDSYNFVLES